MKFLYLSILSILSLNAYGQQATIISDDLLSGPYLDIAFDDQGNYYALTKDAYYTFNLEGQVSKTNLDCGNNCEFTDMVVDKYDGVKYFSATNGLYAEDSNGQLRWLYEDWFTNIAVTRNRLIFLLGNPISDFPLTIYDNGNITGFNNQNSEVTSSTWYDIKVSNDDIVYMASRAGLLTFENGNLFTYASEEYNKIHIDANDVVYLAETNGQLSRIVPEFSVSYTIDRDEAEGLYHFGHANENEFLDHWYALNDEGNLYYSDQVDWYKYNLATDLNVPGIVPLAAEMDQAGNLVVAFEDQDNLYIFNLTGGTSNEKIHQTEIKVFPNPADEQVVINSEFPIERISISDVLGKELISKNQVNNSTPIDVSELNAGNYFIKIKTGGKVAIQKLVLR